MKNPNPQGKGLTPVLDTLAASRTLISVPPKQIDQISSELFTSLFVLHSQFHFKPVVGKSYWLYREHNVFRLSLISPKEWGDGRFGQFIGECQLQSDITWTLRLDDSAARDKELMTLITVKRKEFEDKLRNADTLNDVLPVFEASLPFYQRVFASALANSLGASMQKSGIHTLNYSQAKGLLTNKQDR